jgi:hypothetical protein
MDKDQSAPVMKGRVFIQASREGHELYYYRISWMSRSPQFTQYVFPSRLLIACSPSLHFLMETFLFTTSPHMGQKRTGALVRK